MREQHDHPVHELPSGPLGSRARRGRVRSLLALGTVVGVAVIGTSAAFSDSATVTAEFTAGTLDITVDDEQGNPVPYVLAFTGADAMAPGDTVHAPLRVSNVGSVDAELSMAAAVTPDATTPNATDELRMTIAHTTGTACDAAVVAADASPWVSDGPLASATFADAPLAAGADVELCLAVTLPATVTGTGGGSSEVELTFVAGQAGL